MQLAIFLLVEKRGVVGIKLCSEELAELGGFLVEATMGEVAFG